jgi:GAF domain-containing protein
VTHCHDDPIVDLNRVTVLAAYDFASPDLRPELDDVARRAAAELGAAAAMITLALPDVALLAGAFGLGGWIAEVGGVPIEWAPCAIAVRTGRGYAVPDADADPEFAANPLVAVDGIKALAGAPVWAPDGTVLGACCVADFAPRPFSAEQRLALAGFADEAAALVCSIRLPA